MTSSDEKPSEKTLSDEFPVGFVPRDEYTPAAWTVLLTPLTAMRGYLDTLAMPDGVNRRRHTRPLSRNGSA